MAANTTTLANAIREAYAPGFVEAVFRNNALLPLFGPAIKSPGDTAFRWKVNSSGNDSVEVFTEGAAQPDAGNQAYQNAAVSYTYFRGMVQISGHLRDALRSQWFNALDQEMILLRNDLVDLITTSFMGSTYGIELAIDSTSTYAGIARGSATYWESTETAVSGALAVTDLMDLQETMRDNSIGASPGLILCPLNQETNIYNLGGSQAVKTIGPADNAPGLTRQTFNGMPIIALPDWTDTVIAMLDNREGHWKLIEHRPWSVKEMAPSGDSDVMQVSWAGSLICAHPKLQGKLTGVTA